MSSFVLLLDLMPVSVPLSYECTVYFLITNVHLILGSVKVADMSGNLLQVHEDAPSINYYGMLCSFCKRSMLFCVPLLSNSLFLRQSFLENHIVTTTYQKALILGP